MCSESSSNGARRIIILVARVHRHIIENVSKHLSDFSSIFLRLLLRSTSSTCRDHAPFDDDHDSVDIRYVRIRSHETAGITIHLDIIFSSGRRHLDRFVETNNNNNDIKIAFL